MLRILALCWLCLTAFAVIGQERPVLQTDEAVAAWREDLITLAERMEAAHPNLYWRYPPEQFQAVFAALDAELPYLTDLQIQLGLIRIGALIDGHSGVPPFQDALGYHLFPLQLYLFPEGLYVIDADEAYTEYIGARVVQIGGVSTDEALTRITPLVNRDNQHSLDFGLPFFAIMPEVLYGLGISPALDQPGYVLELPDGEQVTLNPSMQTFDEYTAWHPTNFAIGLRPREAPISLQHTDENFWYTYLEDSHTLYVQYNNAYFQTASGISIMRFADDVEAFLDQTTPERVVLDLRFNLGGDINTYRRLLTLFATHPTINRPGRFFIIIGRYTFSAGVVFLTELEQQTDAMLYVGEPTGDSTRIYASSRPIRLPNSGIEVYVSSSDDSRTTPDDQREWIAPDIPVAWSAADFFAGRDAALEAILGYEG